MQWDRVQGYTCFELCISNCTIVSTHIQVIREMEQKGWRGCHCEGALFGTLFGLLFWKVYACLSETVFPLYISVGLVDSLIPCDCLSILYLCPCMCLRVCVCLYVCVTYVCVCVCM